MKASVETGMCMQVSWIKSNTVGVCRNYEEKDLSLWQVSHLYLKSKPDNNRRISPILE